VQEGAADEDLSDVRYKLLNLGLVTAGVGHCLVLQVRAAVARACCSELYYGGYDGNVAAGCMRGSSS
jgi:hypothetical protein